MQIAERYGAWRREYSSAFEFIRLMRNDSVLSGVAELRNELTAMVAAICTPNLVSGERMLSFAIKFSHVTPLAGILVEDLLPIIIRGQQDEMMFVHFCVGPALKLDWLNDSP